MRQQASQTTMMKRTNVLAQCSMNGASAAERAYFVRVPTGVRAMTKASWLILFVSLLLGCAGVTDDDRSGSESESMIINEGAVLGDVSVLDQGGLIEGLPCDASYAVMAPAEDKQADACETGLGAIPCSERPAGLIAYVIEPKPAVGEESVHDGIRAGVELTALCGASAVVAEGGDAASQLLDPEIAEEEGSVDPSGEAVVGQAEQSPGFKRGIWQRLSSRERGWARKRGKLLVLSGPVFAVNVAKRAVGLSAPTHYFKILFDPNRRETLSFLIPNKALNAGSLGAFRSSIDRIESVTGIDFLAGLDDKLENRLEAQISTMW